jgi:hypothetical protein
MLKRTPNNVEERNVASQLKRLVNDKCAKEYPEDSWLGKS